jgi:hypothetical protein
MAKHGWNSLQHYLEIHEKTLRMYHRYMETPRLYAYNEDTPYHHTLICTHIFLQTYKGTRIRVDIEKDIEVDRSNPKRTRARTFGYTYSANLPGKGELIRYCGPHGDWEEEGSAPHHKRHHKHDFRKNPKGEVSLLGEDDWPHVGEFLEEVLSSF